MVKRLMISYSDDDRDIALEVRDQLAEAGYDVWIAHKDIRGSVDWTQSILDAIDSRDGLVLVWSESAARSENVREEICIARVFLKPIFPLLAHPMRRVPPLPNEINTLQVIQMGNFDSNITELKERLTDPERNKIRISRALPRTDSYRNHGIPILSAEAVNSRIFLLTVGDIMA